MSPPRHHFGDPNHFLVLTQDLAEGWSIEYEEIESTACGSNFQTWPGTLRVNIGPSLIKLQRHGVCIEQKDSRPLVSARDLESQEWMSTGTLHPSTLTSAYLLSITPLREDCVVAIVQEQLITEALAPPHKSLGLHLEWDLLVPLHEKQLLVLGGEKLLSFFVQWIFWRRGGEMKRGFVKLWPSALLVDSDPENVIHIIVIQVVLEFMVHEWWIQPFIGCLILISSVNLNSHCAIIRSHGCFESDFF